jgi:Serine carboxypeptidase
MKISQYDARKWELKGTKRIFPLGHERIESYLGGWPPPSTTKDPPMKDITIQEVLTCLHASPSLEAGQRYQECTDPPYNALAHQDGLGVVNDVVALLENGTKLLFFNGIHDLICNHVGTEVMLTKLPWSKREYWIQSKRYSWTLSSHDDNTAEVVGYVKEYENLQYLKVLDSGHMVPMDVPNVALEMIRIFISRDEKSFSTLQQDLTSSAQTTAASCPVCPTVCKTTTEHDNDNEDDEGNTSSSMITVARSWIGALVAVTLFLGVFLHVRNQRRQ